LKINYEISKPSRFYVKISNLFKPARSINR